MSSRLTEYDYEASSYDKSRFHSKLGRHLDYMHKRIVGNLLGSSSSLQLEMGVGTGRFTMWLAQKNYEVIGMDISGEMLKISQKKAQKKQYDINFLMADMCFLPFRQKVFDGCICINVMDHIVNIDSILKGVKYTIKNKRYFLFNFSNFNSPYMPIAALINLMKRTLFKSNIYSRWLTFNEIKSLLLANNFNIREYSGCMIASSLPLGDKLLRIIKPINLMSENSILKIFSGSIFIKAQLNLTNINTT